MPYFATFPAFEVVIWAGEGEILQKTVHAHSDYNAQTRKHI